MGAAIAFDMGENGIKEEIRVKSESKCVGELMATGSFDKAITVGKNNISVLRLTRLFN